MKPISKKFIVTTNPVKMITDDQTDPTYLKSLV